MFIHRDSEAQDPLTRYEEISEAAAAVNLRCPAVPVVPVRMTEAWLLLDEASIRSVAAKPAGRTDLNLPPPRRVETIPDPKQRLRDALLVASETSGRRRKQFERDFGRHRALLLERLDTTGAVSGLPSWQRLQREVTDAVQHLKG
ncbi:MAG: hypothetical protein JJE52_06830 [Acidimicrobiia bacterium]|nr:hypothetical protein [Acidimicrobiia bacterium]